tara:strand:+ start:533 stop:1111 length:579 start_codon:yes stop_codon:yes gene_type:complete
MLKLFLKIVIFFVSAVSLLHSQNEEIYYKFEGDSITKKEFELSEVTVYNELSFNNSDERIKYLILRRKTLKVYPYATLAAERLTKLNDRLNNLKKRSKRKRYTRIIEKYIQKEFTDELKKLTRTEGQILVKLIHRETGKTTYELLKELRNGFRAFSYNLIAKAFDISLKKEYDPKISREDYFIEDILRKQGY